MSRISDAALLAACNAAGVVPGLAVEIEDAGGTARYWTGYGDLSFNGHTWTGAGALGGRSAIEETDEVYASGVTYSLSGLPPAEVSRMLADMRQGLDSREYLLLFSNSGALVGSLLVHEGLTDVPEMLDSGDAASISICVESRLRRLKTPNVSRYTDQDQLRLHPGDKGFEFVAGLQDGAVMWGPR